MRFQIENLESSCSCSCWESESSELKIVKECLREAAAAQCGKYQGEQQGGEKRGKRREDHGEGGQGGEGGEGALVQAAGQEPQEQLQR